ncbi:MAG: hypothetical protein ACM3RX_06060 [Methanococcaceae archaeon]
MIIDRCSPANSVLFTALPGGYIDGSATIGLRTTASFWLNEEIDANTEEVSFYIITTHQLQEIMFILLKTSDFQSVP